MYVSSRGTSTTLETYQDKVVATLTSGDHNGIQNRRRGL